MITRPTKFENAHRVIGEVVNPIFCIYSSGSIVHAYSYTDMQFGNTHVYPLLDKIGTITESIDISTRSFSTPRTTVQLKNVEHTIISGEMRKLSYVLGNTDVRGEECRVYLMAGQQVADIEADCLCIFKGFILDNPSFNMNNATLTVISNIVKYDINLPTRNAIDIYSDVPPETQYRAIPIVYGKYSSIADDDAYLPTDHLGLAVSLRITKTFPPKYVVSDHLCDALTNTETYIMYNDLDTPCPSRAGTVTLDDSGRTTYTPSSQFYAYGILCDARGYDDYFTASSYDDSYNDEMIDYLKAFDGSSSSYAQVRDNVDDGTKSEGYALYGIKCSNWFTARTHSSTSSPRPEETIDDLKVQYGFFDLISGGSDDKVIKFVNINGNLVLYTTANISSSSTVRYNTATLHNDLLDKNYDGLMFYQKKNTDPDADGTEANHTLSRIRDLRIRAQFIPRVAEYKTIIFDPSTGYSESGYEQIRYRGSFGAVSDVVYNSFVGCDGMPYGTWISSRSSNYSSGDCIEDPAGIIESILRDICGMATADIDLTSFIGAECTSVKARINFHENNKMTASEAIVQLSEQSTFSFVYHSNGKASLVPLMPYSGTTTKIWHSHLDIEKFKTDKYKYLINNIIVKSRWQSENGMFHDIDTTYNVSSHSTNGTMNTFNASWRNICGTSATHVARHMVKRTDGYDANGNGIYANKHNYITFETKAATYAHLEVGDWIEFESDTLDKLMPCWNESWSGKKFLIVSKSHKDKSTAFEAIELF